MKEIKNYSNSEKWVLVVLRILIGWHILYEGFSKLFILNWSSASFLVESKWILKGFANWIMTHPAVLNTVDFLNIWGLIAIGLGLILGFFTRPAAISGAVLLLIYYLVNPPLTGLEYSLPAEGNYLIVSKTLIEVAALVVLAVFPAGLFAGIDMFIVKARKNNKNKREE